MIEHNSFDKNHFEIVMMNFNSLLYNDSTKEEMTEFLAIRDPDDTEVPDFLSFHRRICRDNKITFSDKRE